MATAKAHGRRSRLRLAVEPHAPDEVRRAIADRLDFFNVATTGLDAWHSVTVVLRDDDDEIVGGVLGEIWGGWLHVSYLWVAASHRGHGHGSDLLRAAERFAVARGCHAARLETFSFQAPAFYAKHGYEVFGVLDGIPPGHKQFFLRRALAGSQVKSKKPPTSGRAKRAKG